MFSPADFDYHLPSGLIAQSPLAKRDNSRLLLVDRRGTLGHKHFSDLTQLLGRGDVLVLNQTKVIPARLFGRKNTGGLFELLLIRQQSQDSWEAISSPRLKPGQSFSFGDHLSGICHESDPSSGLILVTFTRTGPDFWNILDKLGKTPIPPYITATLTEKQLRTRYQTVYAKEAGSAAAPTAGLHFTGNLLAELQASGIQIEYITLHVGLGTFQPLRSHHLQSGTLHQENYVISPDTAARLNQAKKENRRIIAVGTTTTRCLESAVIPKGKPRLLNSGSGSTSLFIYPPYRFRFVDSLITNFHLPQTSLLMLVTAFASAPNGPLPFTAFPKSLIGRAYTQAVLKQYRFFSFGDAMWIY